ncbi:hypothetical protein [Halobellus salinisoli]|uniref:hypothetical protein n=1 Tax=Halobellus salinisoli TaxID=3108500 RepID=UPI00300B0D71
MALSPLQGVKEFVPEFKWWALLILLLALSALFLPLPESPFFLGGSLAIILWILKKDLF